MDGKHILHLTTLLLLLFFIVFLKLNGFPMRWWDESMFATNTYEMIHNGKFFSLYFDSLPDLYNTKPPLTSWIQIPFVKLIGYNELALRLPSAIAAALSILLIFQFIATNYNLIWAWLSALILLTSPGFIGFHTARTADSDSLLTLFLLIANINFIKAVLTLHKRYIFLFMLFISIAFATKLYACFLFFPAYLIILIRQKKVSDFVWNKTFLCGLVIFILITTGLIFLRELDTPGYLNVILYKDAGRLFTGIENHSEPTLFYLDNLFTTHFSVWFILLIVGSLLTIRLQKEGDKKILSFFILLGFSFFIIISLSTTKLSWYDMPLYPYFSVISAYPLYFLIQRIRFHPKGSSRQLFLAITCIFIYPYIAMFNKSQSNSLNDGERAREANERYLFERINENKNLDGIKVFYSIYHRSLIFYKYKLAEKGQTIDVTDKMTFHEKDRVLVANDSLRTMLSQIYHYKVLDTYGKATLLELSEKIN